MNGSGLAYSVQEAAELLGLSKDLVYELVRREEFPHVRVGRRILIPRRRLDAWLNGLADPTPARIPSGY